MKRFKSTLAAFIAAIPLTPESGLAASIDIDDSVSSDRIAPVQLRPLNLPGDNLFAAHRSHSSHSSHSSHRSSSGGGYAYSPPVPSRAIEPDTASNPLYSSPNVGNSVNTKPLSPLPSPSAQTKQSRFTTSEKRQLQIMRVQIALTSLGLYSGHVTGELDAETQEAIKRVQMVKGIEPNGLMSTDTLNALGVPAVQ